MWFDVIGNSLAFVGSVLFSADLLKDNSQIEDENATYFDANPYTTTNGLLTRPMYIWAFFLIVTGFAVTLGGNIGELTELSLSNSILISFLTAFGGYGIIVLIYRINKRSHEAAKAKLKIKIFYSSLKNMVEKYEEYVIGRPNEKDLFFTYKSKDIESLKSKLDDMSIPPEQHMEDIVTALNGKRTSATFKRCIENYLNGRRVGGD